MSLLLWRCDQVSGVVTTLVVVMISHDTWWFSDYVPMQWKRVFYCMCLSSLIKVLNVKCKTIFGTLGISKKNLQTFSWWVQYHLTWRYILSPCTSNVNFASSETFNFGLLRLGSCFYTAARGTHNDRLDYIERGFGTFYLSHCLHCNYLGVSITGG